MARYSQTFELYHQSPSALEPKAAFSEDDDMSVLDDKILDANTPDISAMNDSRRISFDHNPEDFSQQQRQRRDSVWPDYPSQSSNTRSRQNAHFTNPLFEPANNNPFVPVENSHATSYGDQPSWALSGDSGSCTPTPIYENFPQEFDGNGAAPYGGGAVGPVTSVFTQMPYRPGSTYPPASAVPMSPQSSQGWISTSSDAPEARSKQTRSPTYRNDSPLNVRRDGIRKKNARFEIPAERNLSNIDMLISLSTDEDEIKELKQQKRLLRNRQAALDSRQRKKLHTEKLEEEKKHYSNMISDLEESLKLREAEFLREKNEWISAQQQVNQYIDNLHMEKEEMVRKHTLETGELRKKNTVLREHIEKLESTAAQPASNPSNFSNEFSDYENVTMDNSPWEDFSIINEFSLDADAPAPQQPAAPCTSLILPNKNPEKSSSQSDHPFSWNAFYMCLLFGAFIASNTSSASNPAIPHLSDEYRAESANVLKAVLESNSESSQLADPTPTAPSTSATTSLPTTISGAEMAEMMSGQSATPNLDNFHNRFAAPTKEQEDQQVFALSADQYNSLTTFDEDAMDYKPQSPSNLQQTLNAMRSNGQDRAGTKTMPDVHSRSLLWDRVPQKVVQDFRRMMRDSGAPPIKKEDGGGLG